MLREILIYYSQDGYVNFQGCERSGWRGEGILNSIRVSKWGRKTVVVEQRRERLSISTINDQSSLKFANRRSTRRERAETCTSSWAWENATPRSIRICELCAKSSLSLSSHPSFSLHLKAFHQWLTLKHLKRRFQRDKVISIFFLMLSPCF